MTAAKVKQKPASYPQKGKICNYREGKGNEQIDAGLDNLHALSHLILWGRSYLCCTDEERTPREDEFAHGYMAPDSEKTKR